MINKKKRSYSSSSTVSSETGKGKERYKRTSESKRGVKKEKNETYSYDNPNKKTMVSSVSSYDVGKKKDTPKKTVKKSEKSGNLSNFLPSKVKVPSSVKKAMSNVDVTSKTSSKTNKKNGSGVSKSKTTVYNSKTNTGKTFKTKTKR